MPRGNANAFARTSELTISAEDVVTPISAALLLIAVLFGSSLFSSSVLTGIGGSIAVRTAGASQLEDRHR